MKLQKIWITALAVMATMGTATAGISVASPATGTLPEQDPRVRDLKVERSENNLFVSMQLDLSELTLKSNREITYLPVLTFGERHLELPRVIVAGRNRYIQNLRHGDLSHGARLCRPGKAVDYSALIPYEQWMETATL